MYPTARPSRPALHHLAAACTLLAVMSFGVWQMALSAQKLERQDVAQDWQRLLSGATSKMIESRLEQGLPARADLITAAYALRYALLNGSQDQVRIGNDGWLFLTEESAVHPHARENQQARIQLIAATSAALARQDVRLVVALVPDKSRIYASRLPERYRPAQFAGRYADAVQMLRKLGVDTVDLEAPLRAGASAQEVYYHSDTHWNQEGARIAALSIAADVARVTADLPQVTFTTGSSGQPYARSGDLVRLMGLEHAPPALRPTPDTEHPVQSVRARTDDSQSLFGDTRIAVALCGTSYSLRGNFAGYLQQALSAEILNTARDGGGFLTSITDYLKDDAFRQDKPKVLIWEIPERFLQAPLDGESGWLRRAGLDSAAAD